MCAAAYMRVVHLRLVCFSDDHNDAFAGAPFRFSWLSRSPSVVKESEIAVACFCHARHDEDTHEICV